MGMWSGGEGRKFKRNYISIKLIGSVLVGLQRTKNKTKFCDTCMAKYTRKCYSFRFKVQKCDPFYMNNHKLCCLYTVRTSIIHTVCIPHTWKPFFIFYINTASFFSFCLALFCLPQPFVDYKAFAQLCSRMSLHAWTHQMQANGHTLTHRLGRIVYTTYSAEFNGLVIYIMTTTKTHSETQTKSNDDETHFGWFEF